MRCLTARHKSERAARCHEPIAEYYACAPALIEVETCRNPQGTQLQVLVHTTTSTMTDQLNIEALSDEGEEPMNLMEPGGPGARQGAGIMNFLES